MSAPTNPPLSVRQPPRRLSRAAAGVRAYLRSAPGTFLWLLALAGTTHVLNHINPAFQDDFLRQRSTNLHELSTRPVRVLVSSAFWLDGGGWFGYFLLYNLFHVPA